MYGFDMSVMRDQAIREPLFEDVDPDQCVTNVRASSSIDLYKVDALDFSMPINLKASTNDYLHAFTVYFNVHFLSRPQDAAKFNVASFSTGPKAPQTHWAQSIFYLPDVLLLSLGDVLSGHLHIHPKPTDARKLQFDLSYSFHGTYTFKSKIQEFEL